MMKRWFIMVLPVIIGIGLLTGCGSGDIEDQVYNVVQSEDTHILGVKDGMPNAYPGKTYGEAFGNFFGSPTWKKAQMKMGMANQIIRRKMWTLSSSQGTVHIETLK